MTSMTTRLLITNQNGLATVNARELHAFLEVKTHFKDWIRRRIDTYGFVDGEDFTTSAFDNDGNARSIFEVDKFVQLTSDEEDGRNVNGIFAPLKFEHRVDPLTPDQETGRTGFDVAVDYHLTVDMAKELSMLENNAKGKEARRYFIKREADAVRLQVENANLTAKLVKSLEDNNQRLVLENKDTQDRADALENEVFSLNEDLLDYKAGPQQLKARIDQSVHAKEQKFRKDLNRVQGKLAATRIKSWEAIYAYLTKYAPSVLQDLEAHLQNVKSGLTVWQTA